MLILLINFFANYLYNNHKLFIILLNPAWQDFTKFTVVFNKKTYKDSLNDLLCFFVR